MGGGGALLALATATLVRQFVQRATFLYDGTEYRGDNLQPITPNDRFYTVTKNIVDPDPTKAVWRLEVGGLVDRPRTYGFDELAALPSTTQETTLMCISNYVGGGLMSIVGNFQTALTPDVPIAVRGVAFGGNRGVARVDVSADGGQTWQEARIDYPGTPLTWAFWTFDFRLSGPDEYHLVARATDGQGGVQTNAYRDTQPEGANGFHSLTVGVTA